MAKKKYNPEQQTFDSLNGLPAMPDGYYSGDQPNPNLRRFVEEHATPYDPEADDYSVSAFNQPITTTKATAIYNMHTYSSKKPHDAIRTYIRHYTNPGDIVFDPFAGSGGTAIAVIIEGRIPITLDRSPAAGYITAHSLRVFDCHDFQSAVIKLRSQIENRLAQRFSCSEPGLVKALAYSETFRCVKCLRSVRLSDAQKGASQRFRGRTKAEDHCPHCKEPIKTSGERLGFVPIEIYIKKSGHKKQVMKKLTASSMDAERFPVTPISPPEHLGVRFEGNIQPRLAKNLARAGATTVAELFSDANLYCLLEIEKAIDGLHDVSQSARSLLHLGVHAILYNCTRMYRHRAKGGFISGTYYIPHLSKCINPWESFLDKCSEIQRGINEAQIVSLERLSCIVSVESAVSVYSSGHIPPNSIDYIFTDPPYGGTYHYGALNFLWEVWRGCDLGWRNEEITISEDGALTYEDWRVRMLSSMKECFNVLKPGRWISLCFHGEVDLWESINDIMAEVGFISSQTEQTVFIDTDQKSYNQITGETSKKRDLVLSYRKPRLGEYTGTQFFIPADADIPTFRDLASQIVREFLTTHPGSTKDRIYDLLISRMVRKGQMEAHDFDTLLQSVAEEVQESVKKDLFRDKDPDLFGSHIQSRWYLKETADHIDQAEQVKEDFAAKRLGKFIGEYLKKKPELEGVHYSDLFEQYLPVHDKPRRLLADWLPEYFIKTPSGTWRLPDKEEGEQLAKLREAGTLRRIKRFANALIEGVPVRDKDRPQSDVDLLDWLRQCRRAGLYEQGRAIYEKGGLNLADLDDEQQIEAEDDYRICVRRGANEEARPKRQRRKKQADNE